MIVLEDRPRLTSKHGRWLLDIDGQAGSWPIMAAVLLEMAEEEPPNTARWRMLKKLAGAAYCYLAPGEPPGSSD